MDVTLEKLVYRVPKVQRGKKFLPISQAKGQRGSQNGGAMLRRAVLFLGPRVSPAAHFSSAEEEKERIYESLFNL